MKRLTMVGLIALLIVGTAQAGPLDPADLPADAKWVMHLDVDAARKTKMAEQFQEKRRDEPRVQAALTWVQARYGIDIRKDLSGITAYGSSYDPHTGIVLLRADYDRDKVKAVMKDEEGYEVKTHRDYEVHTWIADKADQRRVATSFHDDKTVVIGSSVEKVERALDVLDGEKDALKKDASLVAEIPSDAVFYGAAVDLQGLEARDGFLVLQQAERVTVAVGGKEGQSYLDGKFVGKSAEVAEQVQNVVNGLRNLVALQAREISEDAHQLAKAFQVERDDRTLKVQWRADAEQVMKVAQQLEERGVALRR